MPKPSPRPERGLFILSPHILRRLQMTDSIPKTNPIFTNEIVYQETYAGEIRKDISYGSDSLVMDIYYPENGKDRVPVVIFVMGFSDPGFEAMTGMKFMQLKPYTSWARLIAANGMAAVLYSAVDPVADVIKLVEYLRSNAEELNMDCERIAIWSASGNVPNAINLLNCEQTIRCAALCYGYMLDLNGSTTISDASEQFKFRNPNRGEKSFPEYVPILVVQAGKDEFEGLNQAIDQFVAMGESKNCEIELLCYADGVHAFDILDDSAESINVIKKIFKYFEFHLLSK